MSDPALALDEVKRTFVQGERRLEVLRAVSLKLRPGEIVALVGPSGSGKSTLLHIAGLLERADGGAVIVGGRNCATLGDDERTGIRRDRLGFVYQYHHLLPEFSALENVVLPQRIGRPARLSGGEQQRVAIARAVANEPQILLADEPTGNLDQGTAEIVFREFLELARERRLAALIATHNEELARRMDRVLRLKDGVLA